MSTGWSCIVKFCAELKSKFLLLAREEYRMAYEKGDLVHYIDANVLSKVQMNGKFYRNWYAISMNLSSYLVVYSLYVTGLNLL